MMDLRRPREFFLGLPIAEKGHTRECRIELLSLDMIIQDEIRTAEGGLVVAKGQKATPR
jgi:hypothetical protein